MSHTERADDEDDFDPLDEADLEHEELDWEESEEPNDVLPKGMVSIAPCATSVRVTYSGE